LKITLGLYFTKETVDSVDLEFDIKEYHYTLYYYDQAGNLTQTVPPQGVAMITSKQTLDAVEDYRVNSILNLPVYPNHELATNYRYNTLNEVRWQNTPDGGISQFYYDRLGRMSISQNAEQANQSIQEYSYTLYDSLGRIKEVGQLSSVTAMTKNIAFDSAQLQPWIRNNVKEQITRTWYDTTPFDLSALGVVQHNLRTRVAAIAYYDNDSEDPNHAVHYTYDIHGNVNTLVREIQALHSINQGYKRIDYDYDLVSGNVNFVHYQKAKEDQYIHAYEYDADNRLIVVRTSMDGIHWDRDAQYDYYRHGPLKRTTLGELNVQGSDYVYTLHGWLKGVNSNSLLEKNDVGQDGMAGSENDKTARDVYGFSLHYYNGDYKPINGVNNAPSDYFLLDEAGSGFSSAGTDLFNGNIGKMVTALGRISNPIVGRVYQYDQLNRIAAASTYTNYLQSSNKWMASGIASDDYTSSYTYDANGNILTLDRNADNGREMDRLTYHYKAGTNQLSYVDDQVHKDSFDYDIDDQYLDNYTYDKIGNLISDRAEEIVDIQWTVYGKIRSITRKGTAMPIDLPQSIRWENRNGVTQDTTTGLLTKNGAIGWSYGASSRQVITGDGAIEWTLQGSVSQFMNSIVGLTYADGNESTIDYNWYLESNGGNNYTRARNNSTNQQTYTGFQAGDVLRIERKGNTIYWYRNGGLPVYQMTETQLDKPLMVDVHLYEGFGRIENLKIFGAADQSQGVSTKPSLNFEYSPDGHRVAKHVRDSTGTTTSTWYVRDASGNIMATYTKTWKQVFDASKVEVLEIYDEIATNQNYTSRLAFLDGAINWYDDVPSSKLDSLEDEVTTHVALPFLYNFSPVDYLTGSTFDGVYNNESIDTIVEALRAAGLADNLVVDGFCNTCVQDFLVHMMTMDYYNFLDQLNSNDPARFNYLATTLGVNTFQPIPNQIAQIMGMSSPTNTESILSSYGHDCGLFNAIYINMFGLNTPISLMFITTMPNAKTCIRNFFTETQLAQAFHSYFGQSRLWDKVFIASPGTHGDYIASIRIDYPQSFLYYAVLELESDAQMRTIVDQLANQTVAQWLAAVEVHYGSSYYNNLIQALMNNGNSSQSWLYKLNEHHIYGSSRLGLIEQNQLLAEQVLGTDSVAYHSSLTDSIKTFYRGQKRYELSNHLGNVLAVITDRRIQACDNGNVMHYEAQVVSVSDYYPFGMMIQERNFDAVSYRFSFQGQEKDNEIVGDGDYLAFKFRIHDARLGRFLSVDPLSTEFPWNSPYAFAENKIIENKELEGAETINATMTLTNNRGYVMVLQMSNPRGQLQFVRTTVTGTGATPNGTINSANSYLPGTIEYQTLGRGRGNHHHWGATTTGRSFFNAHKGGQVQYNAYRPIIWSANDGTRTNPVQNRTNTIRSGAIITIGNLPINQRVAQNLNFVQNRLNNAQNQANASVGTTTPINNATNTNVTNIPHPDVAGANIAINQQQVTNGNTTVTGVGNFTININGHNGDATQINALAGQLRAANPNVNVNVNLTNTYNGGNAGQFDYDVTYDQTTTTQTTTTQTTTATDGTTGRNIPQGS
jgi:RHS repeat-associated protein